MQQATHENVILQLTVRNQFARRAFNVEGILCLPIPDSNQSRIWLLVNDDQRLGQMISQIEKLEDVEKVVRNQSDPSMFSKIAVFFE
ncbi:MAG: ACT domain-containing protein [Klebsiella michiganensis]|nr:ACT domain-containing protein [Klebsiella michiganensis]